MQLISNDAPGHVAAIIDAADGSVTTYADLRAVRSKGERALVFVFPRNTGAAVRALVSEWASNRVVALLNPDLPSESTQALIDRYQPDRVVGADVDIARHGGPYGEALPYLGVAVRERLKPSGTRLHPDLFLLLATSGTTGGAKFVRLSSDNILVNAQDIATALGITASERALAHLPIHYSFGLSVITSHLLVGASVVLSDDGLTSSNLWNACKQYECTSISGVPAHVDMLRKLTLRRLKVPSIKSVCQAGGRADRAMLEALNRELVAQGGKLFVMYGQTEAGPRITTLPAERFLDKPGSVGVSLASGRLSIIAEDGRVCAAGEPGQVAYEGANVMMGYANDASELEIGDVTGGKLLTGDLGYLDDEGYLFLTGRAARFAKVAGLRLALDEIERLAGEIVRSAAVDGGDKVLVAVEKDAAVDEQKVKDVLDHLYAKMSVPLRSFDVRVVDAFPLKSNGKIDYQRLQELMLDD
jgi:acyl-coenzyme A synthetase/AMP-(fatty) acid ligase